MIPQYKPTFNRETLAKEINDYILGEGYFMERFKTQEFEEKLAEYLGVKYCSCVPNGTIALSLALLANGVKAGDYVLIPNITMMSTQSSVELIGAIPQFIDVDPKNLCMDLEQAIKIASKKLLWSNISALIYVSLNGRSHSKQELLMCKAICADNKVAFIEDNCQSFGSMYTNLDKISSFDDNIGCFSFSVAKAITTGQGGCLVTNNDKLGKQIKKLKDLGRENGGHDIHDEFGINAKFTEIQAIMGLNQLKNIDRIIARKQGIYDIYYNELKNVPQIKMFERQSHETIWFTDIYIPDREELQRVLKEKGIGSRNLYPPLTIQKINRDWNLLPMRTSLEWSKKGLWLPSSLDLTNEEIVYVCDKIKEFYK